MNKFPRGTLNGLAEHLTNLHRPYIDPQDPKQSSDDSFCQHCIGVDGYSDEWPCPTMEWVLWHQGVINEYPGDPKPPLVIP